MNLECSLKPITKKSSRHRYLVRAYGITQGEYDTILRNQGGKCGVCQRKPKKNLAVDHNHKTGKVRGLLCYFCNKFQVGRHTMESARAVYLYLLKGEVGDVFSN